MDGRRRLPLEQALLGFLMQGPLHGYDLHRRAEDELGRIWHMGISNVYGALKRLEQADHVESTLSPQESRPPRKVGTDHLHGAFCQCRATAAGSDRLPQLLAAEYLAHGPAAIPMGQ